MIDAEPLERRIIPRDLHIVEIRLKRTKPALPHYVTVYSKDLNPYGVGLTVTDSIVYHPGDELLMVFVLKPYPNARNVIKLHHRKGKVIWSNRGRVGVQFYFTGT